MYIFQVISHLNCICNGLPVLSLKVSIIKVSFKCHSSQLESLQVNIGVPIFFRQSPTLFKIAIPPRKELFAIGTNLTFAFPNELCPLLFSTDQVLSELNYMTLSCSNSSEASADFHSS